MFNLDFKNKVKLFLSSLKCHKLSLVYIYSKTNLLSWLFKSNIRMLKSFHRALSLELRLKISQDSASFKDPYHD